MTEPKFVPKNGQVDFTNIRYCPVVNCVLKRGAKILLVKRSKDLRLYPGLWNGISGFLDDDKSIEQKVREEIKEEAGIHNRDIISIQRGRVVIQEAPQYAKTWIVIPILVEIKTDRIRLDSEASTARWMTKAEANKLPLVPGFKEVLEEVL